MFGEDRDQHTLCHELLKCISCLDFLRIDDVLESIKFQKSTGWKILKCSFHVFRRLNCLQKLREHSIDGSLYVFQCASIGSGPGTESDSLFRSVLIWFAEPPEEKNTSPTFPQGEITLLKHISSRRQPMFEHAPTGHQTLYD